MGGDNSTLMFGDFYIRTINGWTGVNAIILDSKCIEPVTMEWVPNSNGGHWAVYNTSYMYVQCSNYFDTFPTTCYAYLINPPEGTTSNDKLVFLGTGEIPENPLAGVLYVI